MFVFCADMIAGPAKLAVDAHFRNILRHIELARGGKHAEIYADVPL